MQVVEQHEGAYKCLIGEEMSARHEDGTNSYTCMNWQDDLYTCIE